MSHGVGKRSAPITRHFSPGSDQFPYAPRILHARCSASLSRPRAAGPAKVWSSPRRCRQAWRPLGIIRPLDLSGASGRRHQNRQRQRARCARASGYTPLELGRIAGDGLPAWAHQAARRLAQRTGVTVLTPDRDQYRTSSSREIFAAPSWPRAMGVIGTGRWCWKATCCGALATA